MHAALESVCPTTNYGIGKSVVRLGARLTRTAQREHATHIVKAVVCHLSAASFVSPVTGHAVDRIVADNGMDEAVIEDIDTEQAGVWAEGRDNNQARGMDNSQAGGMDDA